MIPSLIHRIHTRHARRLPEKSPTQQATEAIEAAAAAPVARAHSAVVLPLAAPLAPNRQTAVKPGAERLREVNPSTTSPATLATLLLAGMQQPDTQVLLRIKHLIKQVKGEHLTVLKTECERQAPGALLKFCFKQLPERARADLLAHLACEAPQTPVTPYILSDIDNTVCPSRDVRFPKSTTSYPGRAALWRAILGEAGASDRTCFLSARFGDAVLPWQLVSRRERRVTFENLERVGITQPKVLFGSVRDLPYPTIHGINMSPLGNKKIRNFGLLRQVFTEYRFVFFGDTCEDDLHVGQAMLKTAGKHMGAVFIHDFGLAGRHWTPRQRQEASDQGIIFYKTAPGAALAAFKRNLFGLTREHLSIIARDAEQEFEAIVFANETQKRAAEKLLRHDLRGIACALQQVA